jgi:hypothetical protein
LHSIREWGPESSREIVLLVSSELFATVNDKALTKLSSIQEHL